MDTSRPKTWVTRFGFTAALIPLATFGTVAAAHSDTVDRLTTPEDAVSVWIDVETNELTPTDLVGTLEVVAGNDSVPLDFESTPAGLTAIVEDPPAEFGITLNSERTVDALVAVAYVDATGVVLSETNAQVQIVAGTTSTVIPPAPTDPDGTDGTTDTVTGKEPGNAGPLSKTGMRNAVLGLVGAALVIAGSALIRRRRNRGDI